MSGVNDIYMALGPGFGAPWEEESASPEARFGSFVAAHAETGRSQQDFEQNARRFFPNVSSGSLAQTYARAQQERQLQTERARAAEQEESWSHYIGARLPFASLGEMPHIQAYGRARERYQQGQATPEDLRTIAQRERFNQLQAGRSAGQTALDELTRIPGMVGEAVLGGKILNVPATLAGRVATTPLMPSLWAHTAAEANVAQGRNVLDPRGVAPALAIGVMQNMVLGSLGGMGNAITQRGVFGAAMRLGVRTAAGVAEQHLLVEPASMAISYVLPAAWKVDTGQGLLANAFRGKWGDVWKNLAVSTVTMAAFAGMHELQSGAPRANTLVGKFEDAAQHLTENGVPLPEMAAEFQRLNREAVARDAQARIDALPEGPLKEYAKEAARLAEIANSQPAGQAPQQTAPAGPATQGRMTSQQYDALQSPQQAPGASPTPQTPQATPAPATAAPGPSQQPPVAPQTSPQARLSPRAAAIYQQVYDAARKQGFSDKSANARALEATQAQEQHGLDKLSADREFVADVKMPARQIEESAAAAQNILNALKSGKSLAEAFPELSKKDLAEIAEHVKEVTDAERAAANLQPRAGESAPIHEGAEQGVQGQAGPGEVSAEAQGPPAGPPGEQNSGQPAHEGGAPAEPAPGAQANTAGRGETNRDLSVPADPITERLRQFQEAGLTERQKEIMIRREGLGRTSQTLREIEKDFKDSYGISYEQVRLDEVAAKKALEEIRSVHDQRRYDQAAAFAARMAKQTERYRGAEEAEGAQGEKVMLYELSAAEQEAGKAGYSEDRMNQLGAMLTDHMEEMTKSGKEVNPEILKIYEKLGHDEIERRITELGSKAFGQFKDALANALRSEAKRALAEGAQSGGGHEASAPSLPETPAGTAPATPQAKLTRAFARLLSEETGTLHVPSAEAIGDAFKKIGPWIKELFAAPDPNAPKELLKGSYRHEKAVQAHQMNVAAEATKAMSDYFSEHIEAAPRGEDLKRFLEYMDVVEGKAAIASLPAEQRDFAQQDRDIRKRNSQLLKNEGVIEGYAEDHATHFWSLTDRQRTVGHERAYATYREGVDAGLTPESLNPAELLRKDVEQTQSLLAFARHNKEMKAKGVFQEFEHARDVPRAWLKAEFLKPTSTDSQGWYGPADVVTLANNVRSEGLYGSPGIAGKTYDAFRWWGNILNSAQLGFSAFHASMVSMQSVTTNVATALRMISKGEIAGGLGKLGNFYRAIFDDIMAAHKPLKEWSAPGTQGAETAALIRDILEPGSARAHMDKFEQLDAFKGLRNAWRDIRSGKDVPGGIGNALKNALPALVEVTSKPIMEWLVPRLKVGAFLRSAEFELRQLGSNPPLELRRQTLQKLWDNIENRFGQLAYDNLMMNRTVKDVLMAGVRSLGWNIGTFREIGGGVKDIGALVTRGELTQRTAYLLGMTMVTGLTGAILHKLMTGDNPEELKDYFFPKTGRVRPDGTADRLSLPSYMRDVAALTNRIDEGPFRLTQNAWNMVKSKVHPALTSTAEMLNNENFYGEAIYDPESSTVRKSYDLATHITSNFMPIAFRRRRGEEFDLARQAGGFAGFTPAPFNVVHSAEQQRAIEARRRSGLSPLMKLRKQRMREE